MKYASHMYDFPRAEGVRILETFFTDSNDLVFPVDAAMSYEYDKDGSLVVSEVSVISIISEADQPYAKEDILATIHGLGIRLYDDYKFNF